MPKFTKPEAWACTLEFIIMKKYLFKIKRFFTLLEMVVTLAVFLILVAIVLTFYDTVFKVSSSSSNTSRAFENARVALDIITRDIQCIYYKNEMIPFWHKGETVSYAEEYQNDLLAFISATPLPQSDNISSKLCEVKYQLYNHSDLNEANAGWILRSITGDDCGDTWNFYDNFDVDSDGATNAFTANDDSSAPYQRLIPYVTDLTFECYDKAGGIIDDLESDSTKFPYSIQVELSLMDSTAWEKYKTEGADQLIIEAQNKRTFTKTIFIGEHGQ